MVGKKKDEINFDTPEDLDDFMSEEPEPEEDDIFGAETEIKPAPKPKAHAVPKAPVHMNAGGDEMLDIAADIPVQIVAVMGKKNMTLKELSAFRMGEVIDLERPASEMVDLVAGGKLIAKGELVEIEGKLGVRIVKMMR